MTNTIFAFWSRNAELTAVRDHLKKINLNTEHFHCDFAKRLRLLEIINQYKNKKFDELNGNETINLYLICHIQHYHHTFDNPSKPFSISANDNYDTLVDTLLYITSDEKNQYREPADESITEFIKSLRPLTKNPYLAPLLTSADAAVMGLAIAAAIERKHNLPNKQDFFQEIIDVNLAGAATKPAIAAELMETQSALRKRYSISAPIPAAPVPEQLIALDSTLESLIQKLDAKITRLKKVNCFNFYFFCSANDIANKYQILENLAKLLISQDKIDDKLAVISRLKQTYPGYSKGIAYETEKLVSECEQYLQSKVGVSAKATPFMSKTPPPACQAKTASNTV